MDSNSQRIDNQIATVQDDATERLNSQNNNFQVNLQLLRENQIESDKALKNMQSNMSEVRAIADQANKRKPDELIKK